jgi:hypothetical protein
LGGLDHAVATFAAGGPPIHITNVSPLTRPSIHRMLTGKALFTIGVVTLVSAGAAAAAGVVPTPFSPSRPHVETSSEVTEVDERPVVTDVAQVMPVDTEVAEPEPSVAPETEVSEVAPPDQPAPQIATPSVEMIPTVAEEPPAADSIGPDVDGPAKFGLCTAFEASDAEADDDQSVPFQALTDAAGAAAVTVAEYCADAVPGGNHAADSDDSSDGSDDDDSADADDKQEVEQAKPAEKQDDDKRTEKQADKEHKHQSGDRS